MKFVNTNSHRILVVHDGQRYQHPAGAEFEATGKLADAFKDTDGVYPADSDEAAAVRDSERIREVAGSGSATEAANAFNPTELDGHQAVEAIGRVRDPNALAVILAHERAGKDRKSVVKAAKDRADDLGADLDARMELAVKQAEAANVGTTLDASSGALEDAGLGGLGTMQVNGGSADPDVQPVSGAENLPAEPVVNEGSQGTVTSDDLPKAPGAPATKAEADAAASSDKGAVTTSAEAAATAKQPSKRTAPSSKQKAKSRAKAKSKSKAK